MSTTPPAVLMMTRAPRAGTVKTRLEPLLGPQACARLQRALVTHAAAVAVQAAPGRVYVAVDPPEAVADIEASLPLASAVFAQCQGDLGTRMSAAVARVFAAQQGPVIVIGTDIPTLTAARISAAGRMLESGHTAVFGPALDGGYYLLALARPTDEPPGPAVLPVFELPGSWWGGPRVLQASLRAARAAGLRVGLLPPLRDLDTPADAAALLADGALPAEIRSLLARRTEAA